MSGNQALMRILRPPLSERLSAIAQRLPVFFLGAFATLTNFQIEASVEAGCGVATLAESRSRRGAEHDFQVFFTVGMPLLKRSKLQPQECDDVLQEAVLSVLDRDSGYDGRSAYEGWVYGVVRNTMSSHLRRKGVAEKHIAYSFDPFRNSMVFEPGKSAEEVHAIQNDSAFYAQWIENLLSQLPPLQQTVLRIHILEGKDHHAIAKEMGKSSNYVYTALRKAKVRFAEVLGERGVEETIGGVTPIHYRTLEEVIHSLETTGHSSKFIEKIIFEGKSEQQVAEELGIEVKGVVSGFSRVVGAITTRMRAHRVQDPRMSRWMTRSDIVDTLEEAIAALPERYRGVATQRFLHETIDAKEIAERLGISSSEVSALMSTMMDHIEILLRENKITDPRSGHVFMREPKSVVESIWKLNRPSYRRLLRLRYGLEMPYAEIRNLPEYAGDKNFSEKVQSAENALKKVLTEYSLEIPSPY